MNVAVEFPQSRPAGYEWLDGEPAFDPARHLQLEEPSEIFLLTDLGYDGSVVATKATPVAGSAPFRLLSAQGAAVMRETADRLETHVRPAADRIERMVRGGCYRSRWLRDLCVSPEVARHMSRIYGVDVAPHPMPSHLGHLNYSPGQIDVGIDKWHHDTLPLDYVLTVTDPAEVDGGRFEYFLGTKDEAAALAARGLTPPRDRVVTPDFPGPGYAIALHGDMVVHRAGPLSRACSRISMVNGYIAMDTTRDVQSRCADLIGIDDPQALYTEWARYAAWRSRGRLQALIEELEFSADVDQVTVALEAAIDDVQLAIAEMRAGAVATTHYER